MDLGLKDKVALIGGASSGLGFAAAKALFDEGARVAICSRDKGRIENAAARLSDDRNRVLPLSCDLTDADEINRLVGNVQENFGGIDILVTNCGGPPTGQHDTMTEESWQTGYNKTFMSAIRLIQEVIPGMKKNSYGRVILLTSTAARQPIDNLILSNSYRAGLLGYAKTISRELAVSGITVNTIMPGFINTERLQELADDLASKTGTLPDRVFKDWNNTIPAGRLGEPNELGSLVAFLASDNAAYITGVAIAIDGGRVAGII